MTAPRKLPPVAEVRAALVYEPETGLLRWRYRQGSMAAGAVAGSASGARFVALRLGGRLFYAHRLIWLIVHGREPAALIDHINGNGIDNRLSNLREATSAENVRNSRPRAGTGLKGAYRDKKRWASKIYVDGRSRHLGCFDTPEEAAAAYDAAAHVHFGEFARTNGVPR